MVSMIDEYPVAKVIDNKKWTGVSQKGMVDYQTWTSTSKVRFLNTRFGLSKKCGFPHQDVNGEHNFGVYTYTVSDKPIILQATATLCHQAVASLPRKVEN